MKKLTIKDLAFISHQLGARKDYVQGGGGNTSVKFDDTNMGIKASGYQLSQVGTDVGGFAVVDYKNLLKYFKESEVRYNQNKEYDFDTESNQEVLNNRVNYEDYPVLKPSVETGFHSALLRCVGHTHSVYSNILACSENGEELMQKVLMENGYDCVWIPYIMPGYELTISIKNRVKEFENKYRRTPYIIILQNHGIIAHHDNPLRCLDLHAGANDAIIRNLDLKLFDDIEVLEEDGSYVSNSKIIEELFWQDTDVIFDTELYPDQLVYIQKDAMSNDGSKKRIEIDKENRKLKYNCMYTEAQTIEETIAGVLYVVYEIKRLGMNVNKMTKESVEVIKNWSIEKYRRKIMEKL